MLFEEVDAKTDAHFGVLKQIIWNIIQTLQKKDRNVTGATYISTQKKNGKAAYQLIVDMESIQLLLNQQTGIKRLTLNLNTSEYTVEPRKCDPTEIRDFNAMVVKAALDEKNNMATLLTLVS